VSGRSNLQTIRRLLACTAPYARFAWQIGCKCRRTNVLLATLAPARDLLSKSCRCDITLRLIGHIDSDVIEEEISVAIACHIDHTNAEVRVAEIAYSPSTTPGIRGAPKGVGGLCGREVCCLLGRGPACAAVP